MKSDRKPTHPGEILLEDVIKPLGLTISKAAENLGVARKTLSELIHEKSSLSPIMAVKIAKATKTSAESWLNMQTKLDLWDARRKKSIRVTLFPKKNISWNKNHGDKRIRKTG